jgi:YjbE family integral membrane protein
MEMWVLDSAFLLAVAQIIMIDILLGGDNAVVIALACRRLPENLRAKGIFWGVVGAIAVRIVLIFFALQLLALPFLKLVGAALLLWIGIKLLVPEDEDGHASMAASDNLLGAVRTVIVADVVMSMDNVIAVAGAAKGDLTLVVFGILISVPIIVWGSRFVMKLMDRFPVVITLGGALLGWIAGEMAVSDIAIGNYFGDGLPGWTKYAAGALGAALVVLIGKWLAARQVKNNEVVELSLEASSASSGAKD